MVFIRKRISSPSPKYIEDKEQFAMDTYPRILRYSSPFAVTFDYNDDSDDGEKMLKFASYKRSATHSTVTAMEQFKRKEGMYAASGEFGDSSTELLKRSHYDSTDLQFGNSEVINPLYQYNQFADPRTHPLHPNYGRVYNETLRSNQIITYFRVGRPKYLTLGKTLIQTTKGKKLSESFQDNMAAADGDIYKGTNVEFFDSIAAYADAFTATMNDGIGDGTAGQLYTFEPQFKTYAKLVSGMLTDLAARMNLSSIYDVKGDSGKDFNKTTNRFSPNAYAGPFAALMYSNPSNNYLNGMSEFIPIRVEKSSDYNEEYGNSTRSPAYASELKGLSDKAKDLLAVTGGNSDDNILAGLGKDLGNIFQSHGTMTANGWNMHIPEMWDNSSNTRSLSLVIKLYTPYGNARSVYEDLYVPTIMLMGMALARQTGNRLYAQPPLISLFSKGWFSMHAAMITGMSIKRGGDRNDWTIERLPRSLEIRLTIKDMFPTVVQALNTKTYHRIYWDNKPLQSMLDAYSGLNIVDAQSNYGKLKKMWNNLNATLGQSLTMGKVKMDITHSSLGSVVRSVVRKIPGAGGMSSR